MALNHTIQPPHHIHRTHLFAFYGGFGLCGIQIYLRGCKHTVWTILMHCRGIFCCYICVILHGFFHLYIFIWICPRYFIYVYIHIYLTPIFYMYIRSCIDTYICFFKALHIDRTRVRHDLRDRLQPANRCSI